MRNRIPILLVLLLLTACSNPGQPSAEGTVPGSLEPTANPEQRQEMAISYYDACDYDLYEETGGSPQFAIDIISRDAIDPASISAETDAEACTPSIVDGTEIMSWEFAAETYNVGFHDYLYACYRGGMDWAKAFELYAESQRLSAIALHSPEEMEQAVQADEAFTSYINRYQADYNAVKESYMNSQPFHLYRVYLNFDLAACTEPQTLRQVTLTVAGKDYDLNLGEIRLHAGSPALPAARHNLGLTSITPWAGYSTTPWNDGLFSSSFEFRADTDLVLKKLYAYHRPDVPLEDIHLRCTAEDGFAVDAQWDGASALPIDAGQTVSLSFLTYLPEMAGKANFAGACYYILEYEAEGEASDWLVHLDLCRERNPYELGAELLDGIDVQSYYEQFYNPWNAYQRSEATQ